MAWIAIDAGTSVIKAVAFADDGRELTLAREKTEVLHPQPDWSEQDMDGVWSAVVKTVTAVVPQITEQVRGIVVTAQGDGSWLVDEQGRPTGNAILWNDGRATEEIEQWTASGAIEQSFRISGSVSYPGLPNAIFAWLDKHQPNRIGNARWTLTCGAWLFSKMTGRFAADLSDGSNPFSDVKRGEYSQQIVALYGAEKNAKLLPPLAKGKDVVAPLTDHAASELGLSAGTPIVMAPYDIVSTAYGSGASQPGQACVILGTTICAEVITASLDLTGDPAGTTIALYDGLHLRAMPTLTGCEALDWTARLLEVDGLPALGDLAATAPRGSNGIFFLPYLSPAGERAPFLNPDARGSFHGLTLGASRAALARSVYEGLAFVVRECLATATADKLSEVRVCGGGARSDLWCQLIADATGVTVIRPADSEIGARGAHLFAMAITGETKDITEGVQKHVTHATTFRPNAEAHAFYTLRYETFLKVRETANAQWQLLAGAR
ncbi:MAG: carbohydrate kinase [Acidobacteria bacterium]|nr:carbohydrate kinase [Acidobacteriota bacterium]